MPEDLSWSHFSSFGNTFFKVSAQNFRHRLTWCRWPRKIPILSQPIIIPLHLNCTALSQSESSSIFFILLQQLLVNINYNHIREMLSEGYSNFSDNFPRNSVDFKWDPITVHFNYISIMCDTFIKGNCCVVTNFTSKVLLTLRRLWLPETN